jgi:channel protein (hemolysin III family)
METRDQEGSSILATLMHPIAGFSEPVSSLSHLLGAAVFACLACVVLPQGRGSWGRMTYLGIYAFACVFLLSMSGVYHLLARGGPGRAVLERLDHAAIFVLIAATFTPARIWPLGLLP